VPHPSHAYHPGVSYFGPGRKENVNVIQTGPTGGPGQTHAAHERHPVITTDLAARYASSRSQHSTHPHPLPLESRDPTSHSGGYGKNFSSSPQRRSPVRVVQPTSHETAPVQGNGVIPSSLRFGASSSAASVAPPSFQSSFDPAHPVSGSAALASGHELQSTDSFIERLKQRLAQTNELIGTVRRTQISLEAQEHQ
jgi:hypothetical protein